MNFDEILWIPSAIISAYQSAPISISILADKYHSGSANLRLLIVDISFIDMCCSGSLHVIFGNTYALIFDINWLSSDEI